MPTGQAAAYVLGVIVRRADGTVFGARIGPDGQVYVEQLCTWRAPVMAQPRRRAAGAE